MANGLFGGGDGTSSSPYLIEDAHDLNAVREAAKSKNIYIKLVNDIDMNVSPYNEGEGWEPIPLPNGINVNGNGRIIRNLYINRPKTDNVGLFSTASSRFYVKNVAFINVNITGKSNVGTIAGSVNAYGEINMILVSGEINGDSYTGGIIGNKTNTNNDTFSNIVILANVKSSSAYSGFVLGYVYGNDYIISDRYYRYTLTLRNCLINVPRDNKNTTRTYWYYGSCISSSNIYNNGGYSISYSTLINEKEYYIEKSFSGINFGESYFTMSPKYGPIPSFAYRTYYFIKKNDKFYKYNTSSQEIEETDLSDFTNGMSLKEINSIPVNKIKDFVSANESIQILKRMNFEDDLETDSAIELQYNINNDAVPNIVLNRVLIADNELENNLKTKNIDVIYNNGVASKTNFDVCYETENKVKDVSNDLIVLYKDVSEKNNPSIEAKVQHYKTNQIEYNGSFGKITDDTIMIHDSKLKQGDSSKLDVSYESYKEHNADDHINYINIENTASIKVTNPKISANIKYNSMTNSDREYLGYFDKTDDIEIFKKNNKDNVVNLDVYHEKEKEASKLRLSSIEIDNKKDKAAEAIADITAVYSKNNYYDVIRKYAKISANSGNYSRYLVSIDNGNRWLKFDTDESKWVEIKISNILSQGMTTTEIANNDIWQYLDTTYESKIKFAIGINSESSTNFSVQKITISFDENTAPIISDDEVSLDDYFVYLNGRIYDIENDKLKYQIFTRPTNETEDSSQITEADWKQIYPVTDGGYVNTTSDYTFDHKFELNKFKTDKNIIKIVIQDQRELVTEKEYTVEINAGYPRISINSYNDFSFDGIFEHTENRDVKARIFINDKQFSPRRGYSNWLKVPYKLHFEWSSDDVIYGMPNTIKIELIDDLGNTETMSFIIEGAYKNLLFRDRNNVYYSTDKGEILEQLDLGKIIGGEIADSYEVFLENHTGMDLENVTVFIDPSQMDEHIKIQVSETGANNDFVSADSFTYKGIMKHNDTKVFYVRAEADNLIKAVQDKVYNIYAKGDPVLD